MKLKPVDTARLVSILERLGYKKARQKGSHLVLQDSKGRLIVVPIHSKEIGIGLLRAIIREAGISREAFLKELGKT